LFASKRLGVKAGSRRAGFAWSPCDFWLTAGFRLVRIDRVIEQELVDVDQVLFAQVFPFPLRMLVLIKEFIPLGHGFVQRGDGAAFSSIGVAGLTVFLEEVFPFAGIAPFNRHCSRNAKSDQHQDNHHLFHYFCSFVVNDSVLGLYGPLLSGNEFGSAMPL
jgi:hypothetical protein